MNWKWFGINDFHKICHIWQNMKEHWNNSVLLDKKFVNQLLIKFGSNKENIGICYQKNVPVAIGVFSKVGIVRVQTFQPSQAPLGLWIVSEEISIEKVLSSLLKNFTGMSLLVEILHQDPNISIRPLNTEKIATVDYIQTSFVRIEGEFNNYWSCRSKNLRHNLKRQRNRLREEGIDVRFEVVVQPNLIQDAVYEYGELETKGWKQNLGTNINISNSQGKFYMDVLKDLAFEEKTLIFKYFYNEKLVACDMCIKEGITLIILKTTYDEKQTTTSPALLLLEDIIKYVFALKEIKKIEFYGKVMDWHTKWVESDDIRTMYHINYYRYSSIHFLHNYLKNK